MSLRHRCNERIASLAVAVETSGTDFICPPQPVTTASKLNIAKRQT
jgi:hypothetical protein